MQSALSKNWIVGFTSLILAVVCSLVAIYTQPTGVITVCLIITFIAVLAVKKKIFQFVFALPFILLSLVPSAYVSVFRVASPLGDLRPSIIAILFCMMVVPVVRITKLKQLKEHGGLMLALGLFFFTNIISILVNRLPFENFRFSFFTFVLSFGVLLYVLVSEGAFNVKKMLKFFLFISSVVSILAVLEFFGIQPYGQYYIIDNPFFNYVAGKGGLPRVVSSMGNPLILSTYLLFCFQFVMYFRETAEKKVIWNIAAALHVLGIMFTSSRSSIMILAFIFLFFSSRKFSGVMKNLFLGVVILIGFYFALDYLGILQPFQDRFLFKTESYSYTMRSEAFGVAFDVVRSINPILGVGPNAVANYLLTTGVFDVGTLDNVFLMTLVGSGIVGLILFILPVLLLWAKFRKMESSLKRVGYSLLVIFIGSGFSFNTIFFESVWGIFWLLVGMLFILNKNATLQAFQDEA